MAAGTREELVQTRQSNTLISNPIVLITLEESASTRVPNFASKAEMGNSDQQIPMVMTHIHLKDN